MAASSSAASFSASSKVARIGLISDTHNLVRPEALRHLIGCDAIIHAGDICEPAVLDALRDIAPVTAVRGNNDFGPWADGLPTHATLTVHDITILVVHDIADVGARREPVRVVVTGHSHQPRIDERDGVLFVNPGSAGPRRFKLPISAGLLLIDGAQVHATLHTLIA
ncbi:metallophosphoesterase family protein [Paraburkholderia rhizosphaerae]|uniref:Phosphoesterase n=1 Tax=Paraburkholderia rhizosphaerae TaxID=480658 RepID=A0A4R8LHM6_9BURK|nr:metallophosphoesterase family protein [Paraburkholderia rhizosphaerae]TDY42732.1 hypothetical protein BX592_12095 [Paraburkholderia rhizosphaerae]